MADARGGFWDGLLDVFRLGSKRINTTGTDAGNQVVHTWNWDGTNTAADAGWIPLSREEALQIPGVARAHHTLVSKAAQLELVADNGSGVDSTPQPTFLYRTDLGESPQMRMWCTFDNLYFHGRALWLCDRGLGGQITGTAWVPFDRWAVDTNQGKVYVDGIEIPPSGYLFFNIPMWDGILMMGRRTLNGARDIELAWTARMRSPVAIVEIRVTDDANLSQEEIDAYVAAWQLKHRAGQPAVGFSPPGVTIETHQNAIGSADLFVQARDTIRTDIGSHSSLDGGMVDSTGSAGSLTYETHEGQRADFYEFDLPFWTIPITSRLGLDDVVPRGTDLLVRFRPVVAPNQDATQAEQKRTSDTTTTPTAPAPAPPAITEETDAEK